MGGDIEIVGLDDRERWTAVHRDGGLPSQSWRYARALAESGLEPRFAVVRQAAGSLTVPFFERAWRGHTDVATLPGLSGASLTGSASVLDAWRAHAVAQGWVAGYLQLALGARLDEAPPGDRLVAHNEVFVLDLATDPFAAASQIVRRKLRAAVRSGAQLVEDRDELAAALARLHPATMRRVGAGGHYAFAPGTLRCWALDPDSIVLGARLGDGGVEAVSVFCVAGRDAEYHVNASSERGRELATWLIWHAVRLLRERGVTRLNLGGGARPGDGVYRFKERFKAPPRPLRSLRQVYDAARYAELCERAGAARDGAWFPAYRAPAASGG